MAENALNYKIEENHHSCKKIDRIISKKELLKKVYHPAAKGMIDLACETLLPDIEGPILELLPGPTNLVPDMLEDKEIIGILRMSDAFAAVFHTMKECET